MAYKDVTSLGNRRLRGRGRPAPKSGEATVPKIVLPMGGPKAVSGIARGMTRATKRRRRIGR